VPPVLALYWTELGLTFNPAHPADGEAALVITRITGGDFRLIERLLGRVAKAAVSINRLDAWHRRRRRRCQGNPSASAPDPRQIDPRFTGQG
jgi:hypothetical protein